MNCPENKLSTNTSQFKSDIVFLVDLVTEHSSKVQLVTVEELRTEFLERAPNQKMLTEEEAKTEIDTIPYKEKELRNSADDSPEGKERRRLISRRRMLHSLFNGELSVRDLEKQEGEPAELREVTPEYFDEVYAEALKGPNNIEEFESWDGKRYVHFLPLLSSSFARLMSAQNNPYQLILNTVRESSQLYPRPVGIFSFEFAPFNLDPKVIQDVLDKVAKDPKAKDIRVAETSAGSLYLYSSDYLEDAYADFLAEEMDQGEAEML